MLADGWSDEVQEHGYWGGMRDRIPLSQTDALAATGAPVVDRVRLYHEVSVVRAEEAHVEYVDCRDGTGLLGAFAEDPL